MLLMRIRFYNWLISLFERYEPRNPQDKKTWENTSNELNRRQFALSEKAFKVIAPNSSLRDVVMSMSLKQMGKPKGVYAQNGTLHFDGSAALNN